MRAALLVVLVAAITFLTALVATLEDGPRCSKTIECVVPK